MADETPTGNLEAKTEIPEHQETEANIDADDGYVFDFRNLDDQPAMPTDESEVSVEPEETPAGEEESTKTVKGETAESTPKPESNPEVVQMRQTVEELRSQVANLNAALHQERRSKKAEAREEDAALTDSQLEELYKLHADDPAELRKLVAYQAQQAAKMAKQDALNAVEVQEQKRQAEAHVMSRWKDILEGPHGQQVRDSVEKFKQIMRIENHPLAEHLAFGVMVHENLPSIQQFWYEKGKAEALTASADKGRKDGLKDKTTAPSKGGTKATMKGADESKYLENAKQLGLTPAATKAYIKTMMGKAKSNPSMMADAR